MGITEAIYFLIRAFLTPRLMLAAENLALRQQVSVYKQSVKRPKLRPRDRIFWVWLAKFWRDWRSALAVVQPQRSSGGTDKASSSTGGGSQRPGNAVVLASPPKSAT